MFLYCWKAKLFCIWVHFAIYGADAAIQTAVTVKNDKFTKAKHKKHEIFFLLLSDNGWIVFITTVLDSFFNVIIKNEYLLPRPTDLHL